MPFRAKGVKLEQLLQGNDAPEELFERHAQSDGEAIEDFEGRIALATLQIGKIAFGQAGGQSQG